MVAAGAALALTATVMSISPASSAPSGPSVFSAAAGVEASAASALARRKTKLKVKRSAKAVIVLQPAVVRGKVSGPKRTLILQQKNAYGWRKVDKDKSNKKGKFRLKVPTRYYGKKKMRVVAPPTRGFQGKIKGVSVRVQEGYAPLGRKNSWSRLSSTNQKIRYNPCQKIKYAINPGGLPADAVAILNEAIFRLELASGLRYKYVGTTSAIPFRSGGGKEADRKANLSLAWTSAAVANDLAGNVVGLGGIVKARYIRPRGTFLSTKTGVLIDAEYPYPFRGFENGGGLGALHMHELVHATGLGHADNDSTQVMYPSLNPNNPALYGKGDLTGIKKVGLDAGCLSGGNARPLPGEPVVTDLYQP